MPPIIVVPMIDIMFFLLVFFMLSTMYMTNVKSVPVQFSNLSHGLGSQNVSFAVSVDEEGKFLLATPRSIGPPSAGMPHGRQKRIPTV